MMCHNIHMERAGRFGEMGKKEVVAIILAVAVFFGLFVGAAERASLASAETQFVEYSKSGMQIVPASCESNPPYEHYVGECGSTGGGGGPAACTISASPGTINAGQSSTLSWTNAPSSVLYTVTSRTISPTVGSVSSDSGSISVSPGVTTQYTYTVNYSSLFGALGSPTRTCVTTVVINPGPPQCPPGQWWNGTQCVDNPPGSCPNGLDISQYPSCTCPSGYTQQGNSCVLTSVCPNGLNISLYPTCTCPVGQFQSGSICISSCPNGLNISLYPTCSCPQGQTQSGDICVGQCTPIYFCQGNDLYFRSAQCTETFQEACAYGCAGSACLPAPSGTADIRAVPPLVKPGLTTVISWSTTNVQAGSCAVTENNPTIIDSWTGASGSQPSSGITQQTIYTLRCTGLNNQPISDSVVVNIVPDFEEE